MGLCLCILLQPDLSVIVIPSGLFYLFIWRESKGTIESDGERGDPSGIVFV